MSSEHRGTLYLRIGPMFSGKTTWLNAELTNLLDKGLKVKKIVHSYDFRETVTSNDYCGSTHNSSYTTLNKSILVSRCAKLADVSDIEDYHVIGVDESQFFPDLAIYVRQWVDMGKHVRVSGLDGDANQQKFGQTLDLIPFCDEVVKMQASCAICLKELQAVNFHGNILSISAPFTRKISMGTDQIDIGGTDKYLPVCRYHHTNL